MVVVEGGQVEGEGSSWDRFVGERRVRRAGGGVGGGAAVMVD